MKHKDTIARKVAPYAIGGERDVRLRAVEGVAKVEGILNQMELELRGVGRIGRLLRLRFRSGERRFVWCFREGPRRWVDIGARIQLEVLRRLYRQTRAKVLGVERALDVRTAGMICLRLIKWVAEHGADWAENTVTLRWREPSGHRAWWAFSIDGGILRRGEVVENGSGVDYPSIAAKVAVVEETQGGKVTESVEVVVERLAEIDRQLRVVKGALTGWLRLYYGEQRDVWGIWELVGIYLTQLVTRCCGAATRLAT